MSYQTLAHINWANCILTPVVPEAEPYSTHYE